MWIPTKYTIYFTEIHSKLSPFGDKIIVILVLDLSLAPGQNETYGVRQERLQDGVFFMVKAM